MTQDAFEETMENPNRVTRCLKVSQVLSRVGDKWLLLIIMLLREKSHRFGELKSGINGISQRMLTLTLRNMERDGIVIRTVTPSIPPRVDYELTQMGLSLANPAKALGDWAAQNLAEISSAQARYDAQTHRI